MDSRARLAPNPDPKPALDSRDRRSAQDLPSPEVRAWQTGLLRADRVQHASLAMSLGLGVGLASREPIAAAALPAVLGLAKEIADLRGSGFDGVDLLADLIGAATAAALTSLWK